MTEKIKIYTDGSSLGNPGPGGYSAIILEDKNKIELKGGAMHTTNNRMEMQAMIEALKWTQTQKKTAKIELYSDSMLLLNSLKHNWKNRKNLDLWKELKMLLNGINIDFHWVKGHHTDKFNNLCDKVAREQAFKYQKEAREDLSQNPIQSTLPLESENTSSEKLFCPDCMKDVSSRLGFLPDANLIRADCSDCNRFIKFLSPTEENLKTAKKRTMISNHELQSLMKKNSIFASRITKKQIQILKSLTAKEANHYLQKKFLSNY